MIPIESSPIHIILVSLGWIWDFKTDKSPDNIVSPITKYKPFTEELNTTQPKLPIKTKHF